MKKMMFLSVLFLFACQNKTILPSKEFKKVALVIGNQDYVGNLLENPINDAEGITKSLEKIGFDVNLKKDVTLAQFYEALEEVKQKIIPQETIFFFYFAGHGNSLKNSKEEYLLMTDREKKVIMSIYRLYEFLDKVKARHNIVVIDACRNYQHHYIPLEEEHNLQYLRSFRNFRGNFTIVRGEKEKEFVIHDDNCSENFPRSTIVSYATSRYQKASDWSKFDEHHSPYTRHLIEHLKDREIPIGEVFRRVREELIAESNRTQINLEESSLEKNVWLVPKEKAIVFSPPI